MHLDLAKRFMGKREKKKEKAGRGQERDEEVSVKPLRAEIPVEQNWDLHFL